MRGSQAAFYRIDQIAREAVQHLIKRPETQGETGAADLLSKVGGLGDAARDLAYRLYTLCERKKWAEEALHYNSLIVAWPEICKLASQQPRARSVPATGARGHQLRAHATRASPKTCRGRLPTVETLEEELTSLASDANDTPNDEEPTEP